MVDGTGAPWFRADVCIAGDKVAIIGDLSKVIATRRVDASNLVIAPGFIDLLGQSEFNVLTYNRVASKITQGITTEITGEVSLFQRSAPECPEAFSPQGGLRPARRSGLDRSARLFQAVRRESVRTSLTLEPLSAPAAFGSRRLAGTTGLRRRRRCARWKPRSPKRWRRRECRFSVSLVSICQTDLLRPTGGHRAR